MLRRSADAPGGDYTRDALATHSAFRYAWLANGLSAVGEFGEAISRGQKALRDIESPDSPAHLVVFVHAALGLTYLGQGDLEKSIPLLDRGLALARTRDVLDWSSSLGAGLAYAYALSGGASPRLFLSSSAP